MKVALLVPGFSYPGDAVGNDVHGMYVALKEAGFACGVFCHAPHGRDGIDGGSFHDAVKWLSPDDLVIYHYVGGDPFGLDILRSVGCEIVLRFHNVTPSHFFEGISQEFVRSCEEGRRQLPEFLQLPRLTGCSASTYSAAELVQAGLPPARSRVVPPFHMTSELRAVAESQIEPNKPRRHAELLYVGRVAPHKGIDTLLNVFAALLERIGPRVRLTIVGSRDVRLAKYFDTLTTILVEHGTGEFVRFRQDVSIRELARSYAAADLFVTCSEHEGFCVPVVEAMALGIPVVARNGSALAETVGGAGILCSDQEDFVSALEGLISDKDAARGLGALGKQRFESTFETRQIAAQFMDMVRSVLPRKH